VVATEKAIAKLEGSEWALLTASGMAAIDVALSIASAKRAKQLKSLPSR
jgi:cystathionine beta-lyase/cystathionine gamma-synthase